MCRLLALLLFLLTSVGCPQRQPLMQYVEQPGTGDSNPGVTEIKNEITKPPAFNPTGLNIKIQAMDIQSLPPSNSMPQYRIQMNTGISMNFTVEAGGQGIDPRKIFIDIQPPPDQMGSPLPSEYTLTSRINKYMLLVKYAPNTIIEPLVMTVRARDIAYCEQVFKDAKTQGEAQAVDGSEPDIPQQEADCRSSSKLFNFDQKARLEVHINNVEPIPTEEEKARAQLYCNLIDGINTAVWRAGEKGFNWGGEVNSWQDIIGDTLSKFAGDYLKFRIVAHTGLACK